jgi:hypothetical protein
MNSRSTNLSALIESLENSQPLTEATVLVKFATRAELPKPSADQPTDAAEVKRAFALVDAFARQIAPVMLRGIGASSMGSRLKSLDVIADRASAISASKIVAKISDAIAKHMEKKGSVQHEFGKGAIDSLHDALMKVADAAKRIGGKEDNGSAKIMARTAAESVADAFLNALESGAPKSKLTRIAKEAVAAAETVE